MKYCRKCKKEFDTEDVKCPLCGADLIEEDTGSDDETAETVAVMTILGFL